MIVPRRVVNQSPSNCFRTTYTSSILKYIQLFHVFQSRQPTPQQKKRHHPYTLPKTNGSPLKIGYVFPQKEAGSYPNKSIFKAFAVSFREKLMGHRCRQQTNPCGASKEGYPTGRANEVTSLKVSCGFFLFGEN